MKTLIAGIILFCLLLSSLVVGQFFLWGKIKANNTSVMNLQTYQLDLQTHQMNMLNFFCLMSGDVKKCGELWLEYIKGLLEQNAK